MIKDKFYQLLADLYHRFLVMAGYGNRCSYEVIGAMDRKFLSTWFVWEEAGDGFKIMRDFKWVCYDFRK